jgi:hypothetical protein
MKLSKKNDFSRKWRSFKKHAFLMLQPFVIAVISVIVWDWLRKHGYYLPKEDETITTVPVMGTLGIAFSIIASISLGLILEKRKNVVLCTLKRDKEAFLLFRDERIPIILHLFLTVISVFLLGMAIFLEYKARINGIVSVFIISFMVTLYWIVVPQLEDTGKSVWFSERIPPEWLKEDVDLFFRLHEDGEKKQTEE